MDLWWIGRCEYVSTHSLKIIPKVKLIRCSDIPKFQKWRNTTSISRSRKIFHRTNIEATYMSFLLKINQRLIEDLFNSRDSGTLINIGWGLRLAGTRTASMQCICVRCFFIEALTSFLIVWWCAQQSYWWSTSANHQLVSPHFSWSLLIFSWCLLIFYLSVCLSFIGQWLIVAHNSWDHIQFTRNTE